MDAAFADRAIHLPESDALVLADLHLGRGASANVELPLSESDVPSRLAELCERFSPTEVVLAGDVLHSFDRLPDGVRETFHHVERTVEQAGARLIVTPGNHDTLLDAVWDGPTADEHRVGKTVVCHGHALPDTAAERYVVGHDHPAIRIEGQRRPCYLVGRSAAVAAEVVVLPSFTKLAPGVVVNQLGALDSPLVTDLDEFRPVVRDEDADETLEFPPLGTFRELL
ncbi:metallophosphoesterase [Halococcus saccharolyticus]|uniref:Metallophosphoesterase n=1 Tax=Halococcus saccharolyticus DSM 5350 TaxID=1227455 RepID=M0MM66_9EURY|nr:metallophosphoesterase [Halococcus saccharolyticus]EMA45510.1 metallophosphoesterase [Halococcus saccharolyticus DSM 5350]